MVPPHRHNTQVWVHQLGWRDRSAVEPNNSSEFSSDGSEAEERHKLRGEEEVIEGILDVDLRQAHGGPGVDLERGKRPARGEVHRVRLSEAQVRQTSVDNLYLLAVLFPNSRQAHSGRPMPPPL
eukprot:3214729-Pyramimonas_sp.AAC.1